MVTSTVNINTNLISLNAIRAGDNQLFLVARPAEPAHNTSSANNAYDQIAKVLHRTQMEIIHERVFGSLDAEPVIMTARKKSYQKNNIPCDTPVTYIQGSAPWGSGLAGIQIQAVSCKNEGDRVWTIMDNSRPCGRGWRHKNAQYIILQNLQGLHEDSDNKTRLDQVHSMIERAHQILRQHQGSYRDVVRTWFYLSDILDWYHEFNGVRNRLYDDFGIMPGAENEPLQLPASTGIQGDNIQGSASVMDLLAIIAQDESRPSVQQLSNQRQKDAFRYGSAFSRGALISQPDVSLIQVSGTAPIDEAGQSQFPEDIKAQINCTFDKIEALLADVGANLKDICSATVFVKHPEDIQPFWTMAADRGLGDFPCVCVVADVCRAELLFEIDAIAAFHRF
ncbi:Rid family hydrolase [Planctomycetota bacterium]